MEDEYIIQLFISRDERAITETSAKYNLYCQKIAFNILKDRLDTDECINDVYLKLWNCIPPNMPDNLPAFIAKLTRNTSIDIYKSKHRLKRIENEYSRSLDELAECIPDDKDFEISELKDILNRFLYEQNTDARKIFVRRFFYSESIEQISEFFGISQSKVKSSLFRTKQKLKKYLRKENYTI